MPALQVQVICVRPVAQHEADSRPCFVSEDDISGRYVELNKNTLYCEDRSLYLSLNREAMAKARAGVALRVSPQACS